MTNAIKQYDLSKLDIFTPNRLHPTLPPLAHGEYSAMNGVATSTYKHPMSNSGIANSSVIYEPDLMSRQNHIHGQLSPADRIDSQLRKRVRRHDTLVAHMEVAYCSARKMWYQCPRFQKKGEEKSVRTSMETKESRDEFVREGLARERAAMCTEGASEEIAIKLD